MKPAAEIKTVSFNRPVVEFFTILRFNLIGILAAVIHTGLAWLLIVHLSLLPLLANLIAFLNAFLFSFSGHFYWTFKKEGKKRRALARFFTVALIGFVVNNILLIILLSVGNLPPVISTILAAMSIPAFTYILSRFWAFQ